MAYTYDSENIFAKILRGEIPNQTVLETEHSLAFDDINPQAPVHVLVIPKGPYVDFGHFNAAASTAEREDFALACAEVAKSTGLSPGEGGGGYRVIANAGHDGVQEVPHYHIHILGGRRMGPMVYRPS